MMSPKVPFLRLWRVFDSPILQRELRTLLRSRRSFFWLALYLVVLIIAFSTTWTTVEATNRDVAARTLFAVIVATQSALFFVLAPILTAGSLAGEQERRTFDLLATTPLSGYHIVLAKCFAALCYVLLLIVASLPILALTFLMGGVGLAEMALAAVSILAGVLVNGMVGVACSAWVRQTYVALMMALAVVVAKSFMCPCAGGFASFFAIAAGGSTVRGVPRYVNVFLAGYVILQLGAQLLVFLGFMVLARNGYLAGSRGPRVRPKRIIRSRTVLKQRRRRYPYYLIDPLAAPEPIPDGTNAIYVKDKRHQPLGRLDFVIRISYICLLISLGMGLWILGESDYLMGRVVAPEGFFPIFLGVSPLVVGILLIASPLFASTVFTTEKEHGTFVSLMTTLITPPQILWAKMRIILRYSLVLIAALFGPAFLVNISSRGNAMAFLATLLLVLPFYLLVVLASGLLGMLISALSRRTMVSMALTYLIVLTVCFGPVFLESFGWRGGGGRLPTEAWSGSLSMMAGMAGNMLRQIVWPLLSPFRFLSGGGDVWLSATSCYKHPERVLVYGGFWAAALAAMFWATLAALDRTLTKSKC